jgi:hypothetical protein
MFRRGTLAALLCIGCGGEPAPVPIEPATTFTPMVQTGSTPIVAWGDSLTQGGTASSPAASYPAVLSTLMGRTVVNEGVSGQSSSQIAARQGGAPALLTIAGDTVPPQGPAVVQEASVYPVTPPRPTLSGSLDGVHGLLSLNSGGQPVPIGVLFTRDDTGEVVTVPPQTPFIPDTTVSRDWINVLWLGRNNLEEPDRILADLRACADTVTAGRYLVLGIVNADDEGRGSVAHGHILALNARLAGTFGDRYLDIRQVLIDGYDPADPQDQSDHANDVPPSSLRANRLHPNDAGYLVVATAVADAIRQRGW